MISSDADNAPGTVYYAAAMTGVAIVGCFIPEVILPFGIGVMCTSIGDGLAGTVGQLFTKYNPKIFGDKTLFGSLTNFAVSSLSAYVISSSYSMELGVLNCLMIGLLSAELELVTPYGFDNVSVTWGTTALAYAFMYFTGVGDYLAPILLSPVIVIFALSKNALTKGGVALAIALDIAVSCAFGNRGFVVLSSFFIGAEIVDKIKNKKKSNGRDCNKAGSECRNYVQVLANGMVAFLASLSFVITENNIFIVPFVASVAEAFSDTVASGIGVFAGKTFDPFKWRKCECGLSGGMSIKGTCAALIGAVLISFIAYSLGLEGYGIKEFFAVAACAFLGSVFDSFLGSSLQVKYKCSACGIITEREEHCSLPTERHSGVSYVDNDVVNILSSAFSAVLATILVILN